jgi:Ca2+-transporting ATPase
MLHYSAKSTAASPRKTYLAEFVTELSSFTNELKMMGHVWRKDGSLIIAAKGSPERILTICDLSEEQRKVAEQ